MTVTLADLVARLRLDDRDFRRGLTGAQQKLKESESRFDRFGLTAARAGSALTKGLTLPIIAVGALSLKTAIDFESAFAGVRKTVEATEPQFAALETGIRNMAKQLPSSATEIARVAEAAGQLGIETESILGFSRVMIDLGETTNLAADEAATALARLANITKLPQDQFDRLGSTIVALGNNMATTEAEIVEMGLRIAGAGKQVGLTEAQTLSFAAALSSVGIEAQAGGTAISKTFIEVAQAVANGGDKLDAFAKVAGVSSAEFQRAFQQDAAGALISFIEGLDGVSQSGGNVFAVLDKLGLSEIRVRDAMLRAAGAGDLFREAIDLGSEAWKENTALTEEARKRYETTAAKLEVLRNQLVDLGITLGRVLMPILQGFIQIATPIIGFLARLAESFDSLPGPIKSVALTMVGIAAAAGPLLLIVGKLSLALGPGGLLRRGLTVLIPSLRTTATATTELARNLHGPAGSFLPAAGGAAAAAGRLRSAFGVLARAAVPVGIAVFGVTELIKSQQGPVDALIAKVEEGTATFEDFSGVNSVLLNKSLKESSKNMAAFANSADGLKFIGQEARSAAAHLLGLASQVENPATKADLLNEAWKALRTSFDEGTRAADAAALSAERTGESVGDLGGEAGDASRGFDDLSSALDEFNKTLDRTLGVTLDAEQAADDLTKSKKDLAKQIEANGPIFKGNSDAALANRDALRQVIEKSETYADALILSGKASVESKPDILIASLKTLADKYPGLRTQIQLYIDKVKAADGLTISTPVKTPGMIAALANLDKLKAKLGDVGSVGITIYTNQVNAPGKAGGGSVFAGQTYMVGEKGKELFVPSVSGTIIPNDALQTAGTVVNNTSSRAGDTYNITVVTPDPASESLPLILRREQMLHGRG